MDNEHRCILLMPFWIHRDTMTRSWGPLLCHSSTTITSCCSMIMHGRVARICTQFLEAENIPVFAWPAYSPDISPIEHVWDALDRRIRQRVPVLTGTGSPPPPPPPPSHTVKLHILEWPFIVASLRHTCAIIIMSNQCNKSMKLFFSAPGNH